jgi:hypothetical protein
VLPQEPEYDDENEEVAADYEETAVYRACYHRLMQPGDIMYSTLYTIHHTPYTAHHTPYTIHHTPYTIHHTPYTIHHTPYSYGGTAGTCHDPLSSPSSSLPSPLPHTSPPLLQVHATRDCALCGHCSSDWLVTPGESMALLETSKYQRWSPNTALHGAPQVLPLIPLSQRI